MAKECWPRTSVYEQVQILALRNPLVAQSLRLHHWGMSGREEALGICVLRLAEQVDALEKRLATAEALRPVVYVIDGQRFVSESHSAPDSKSGE